MEDRTKKTQPSSEQGHKKQSQGNTQAPKGANPARESERSEKSSNSTTQQGHSSKQGSQNEREERDRNF